MHGDHSEIVSTQNYDLALKGTLSEERLNTANGGAIHSPAKSSLGQRIKDYFSGKNIDPEAKEKAGGLFSRKPSPATSASATGGTSSVNGNSTATASGAARQAEQEGITFIESASQRVTRGREALNRAGNAVAETAGTAARGTGRQASRAWDFSKRGVGGAIGWTKGKLGKGALWTAGGLAVAAAAYAAASAYFGARSGRRMTRERVQADQERAMQQEMAAQQAAVEEAAMAQQMELMQQQAMDNNPIKGPHTQRVLAERGQIPAQMQAVEAPVNPPVEAAGVSAIDGKPVEQLNSPLRQ